MLTLPHRGPEIESWFGVPEGTDPAVENDWSFLPFMALSDGAHTYVYFSILCPSSAVSVGPSFHHLRDVLAHMLLEPNNPETHPLTLSPAVPAHRSTEDFSYFTLRQAASARDATDATGTTTATSAEEKPPTSTASTASTRPATSLFGMSCTRQLDARELHRRPDDVTRSTVQKSVVVVARSPHVFMAWREKLSLVTRAWFLQRWVL